MPRTTRVLRVAAVAILLAGIAGSASAQVPQTALDPGHQRAAEELIEILDLETVSARSLDVMIESMTAGNPAAATFAEIIREFMNEFLSWKVLYPEYVKLYAGAFTESELRDLIRFFGTPTGQKWVEATPVLMQEAAQMTERLMQPHMGELERRIMARIGS